jgi:hypothetical protein
MALPIQASLAKMLAPGVDSAATAGENGQDGFGDLLAALLATLGGPDGAFDGDGAEGEGDATSHVLQALLDGGGEDGEGALNVLHFASTLAVMAGELDSVIDPETGATFEPAEVIQLVLSAVPATVQPNAGPVTEADGAGEPAEADGETPATKLVALDTVDDAEESAETGAEEDKPPSAQQRGSPPSAAEEPARGAERVVRTVGNADEAGATDSTRTSSSEPKPFQATLTSLASASSATSSAPGSSQAASASAPTPPQFPVPAPPAAQVGQAIIDRIARGGGEARIQLDPPDLGEVLIRVRIDGDRVRIEVHVERPEAAQLLRSSSGDLSSLLGQRGLNLDDVTVEHGAREHHQRGPEGGDTSTGDGESESESQSFAAVLGIDSDDEGADLRQLQLLKAAYNPDGAYLYRI